MARTPSVTSPALCALLLLGAGAARAGDPAPAAAVPVATLTRVPAAQAPTVDGAASDPAWARAPELLVEAVAGERRVAVRLRACRTDTEQVLLCRWADEGEDASGEVRDGLRVRWGAEEDAAPAHGRPLPAPGDVSAFEAGAAAGGERPVAAGRWADGAWVVELRRSLLVGPDGAAPRAGALCVEVRDPRRGRAPAVAPWVRVRDASASEAHDFETDRPDAAPQGFVAALAGGGKAPSWVVRAGEPARGRVLVQESQDDEGDRFPLALCQGFKARDVDVSVRFRALKGFKDQGAGLVLRVKDAHNHYILRANVLEQNVVCFKMEDNLRVDLPPVGHEGQYGVELAFDKQAWHVLRAVMVGDRLQAYLDGRLLYEVVDATFRETGGAGVWTKSDSVMAFDDFVAATCDPQAK